MTYFPSDLPLTLDRAVWFSTASRVLIGGEPTRALRLSRAGVTTFARICSSGAGPSKSAQRLARTLVDGGLAHPRPAAVRAGDVTVVVAVRDRTVELDHCLAAAGGPAFVVDDGSCDPAAVLDVCVRYGARLARREIATGPGAARNIAMKAVDTPFVAFLDSDCVPEAGWIDRLRGHFADPLVGAVAPRVRGITPSNAGPVGRFAAARSPLDLGSRPARVLPGGRVSYVPTAALLVRRSAFGDGFDPALRYGEDVDLVWRLHDSGWRIRYDPSVIVGHREPTRWRDLVVRRYRYGTSAAPLAARHSGRLAPTIIDPWSAVIVGLALAGKRWLACGVAATRGSQLALRLRPAGVPARWALLWPFRRAMQSALSVGRASATLLPLGAVAATTRRGRVPTLVLMVSPPILDWVRRRPALDPLRWAALSLLDDAAYGLGVWRGCLAQRTLAPLRPARRAPNRRRVTPCELVDSLEARPRSRRPPSSSPG